MLCSIQSRWDNFGDSFLLFVRVSLTGSFPFCPFLVISAPVIGTSNVHKHREFSIFLKMISPKGSQEQPAPLQNLTHLVWFSWCFLSKDPCGDVMIFPFLSWFPRGFVAVFFWHVWYHILFCWFLWSNLRKCQNSCAFNLSQPSGCQQQHQYGLGGSSEGPANWLEHQTRPSCSVFFLGGVFFGGKVVLIILHLNMKCDL